MLTFEELKNAIAAIAQRGNDTAYISEIGTWLNLGLTRLYNSYDFFHELKGEFNFTTVDGTALYYMPSDFEKANRIYDVTNNTKFIVSDEESYFDANIANIADATEGQPNTLYFKEVVGVKVQVSTSGGTVKAVSSSTSDTAVVRVEGYLDSLLTILGFENITLNGTTEVAGSTTFYKITHFSKSADTAGYVSLLNSSSSTLGALGQIDRVARYKAFRLGLIPNDSTTNIRVLYKKRYTRLVNNNDYSFVECDDFLIFFAVYLSLNESRETLERALTFKRESDSALSQILHNQNTKNGTSFIQKFISPMSRAHRS